MYFLFELQSSIISCKFNLSIKFSICILPTWFVKTKNKCITFHYNYIYIHWRRKWQPTPVFLPGESQGQRSLVGCRLWGHRVGHDWSDLTAAAALYISSIFLLFILIWIPVIISVQFSLFRFMTSFSIGWAVLFISDPKYPFWFFILLHRFCIICKLPLDSDNRMTTSLLFQCCYRGFILFWASEYMFFMGI